MKHILCNLFLHDWRYDFENYQRGELRYCPRCGRNERYSHNETIRRGWKRVLLPPVFVVDKNGITCKVPD